MTCRVKLIILAAMLPWLSNAQRIKGPELERIDTIAASVKVDSRMVVREIGHLSSDIREIRAVISPLGEGDPIKWIQGLPGVTTGADGTTAVYVRGGNLGNSMISIDGVPVYGYSHLLGITTAVPQAAISGASLTKGGFDGSEGNFTAGHLRMNSKVPERKFRAEASVNNFIAGVNMEGGLKRLSFLASARVSPLTYEYSAVKGLLGGMDNFAAGVGDLYGKMRLDLNSRACVELSGLRSFDDYTTAMDEDSCESFGWGNTIGILRFMDSGEFSTTQASVYVNEYASHQVQDKMFRGVMNHLSLQSRMTERVASIDQDFRSGKWMVFNFGYGVKYRQMQFAPGQIEDELSVTRHSLLSYYGQMGFDFTDRLFIRGFLRQSVFRTLDGVNSYTSPHTEGSAVARLFLDRRKRIVLEASYDNLAQFYHTLEGLPTGWSLDLLVPSGWFIEPECARQKSVGLSADLGSHSVSVTAFDKEMTGLIYFKYSQALFSGALAHWERSVEQGSGDSYGIEFLYEWEQGDWYARSAYTLSRTTRYGFPSVNEGGEFHARFDRTHVLNAFARWRHFSSSLTVQSGNWENGASEKFNVSVIPDGTFTGDYYSTINNYRMPTVFRLDVGYNRSFKTGRIGHEINAGVCNVTNHFNPFMLYYDASTEKWKGLCLLPILPNFSYRVKF